MDRRAIAALTALTVLACAAEALPAAARTPEAPLPGASGPVLLGPYFEKLVDREGGLGIDEVRTGSHAAAFTENTADVPNLGLTDAALWLRFRLSGDAARAEDLLLEIRHPAVDRIEFYASQRDAGPQYRRTVVGDTLPWRLREIPSRSYVFRLDPGQGQYYYLRVTNQGPLAVPAYLWREEQYISHSRSVQLGQGVFYGLCLALVLYNLMLFFSIRDRAYLYYVLYGSVFFMWVLGLDGVLAEYPGREGGWWPHNGLMMFNALSIVFGVQFARSFLGIRQLAPLLDRVLLAIAAAAAFAAFCGATGWLLSYRAITRLDALLGIAVAVLVVIVAVRAIRRGNRSARFLLLAWAALLIGLVALPLAFLGVLPYNAFTANSLHAGLGFDLVLLSLALGDRYNQARREAAVARTEARAMEIASRHKSEFLASMSHELRTPLNAILGFSEMLRERYFGGLTEKQAEYVDDIREAGGHLLSLINDVLDLSKVEAGRMELELSRFHLPSAISSAIALVRERAHRHGVELASDIDPRIGELEADERKVKQILLNLLSNAVKFTPDGGRVHVSAKLDTDHVNVAVSDTGPGIALEDQRSLFEPFKQVGKDAARKAEGTGLGLALTKRFVELHGGRIRVDSAPGKGSIFSFTLPN